MKIEFFQYSDAIQKLNKLFENHAAFHHTRLVDHIVATMILTSFQVLKFLLNCSLVRQGD